MSESRNYKNKVKLPLRLVSRAFKNFSRGKPPRKHRSMFEFLGMGDYHHSIYSFTAPKDDMWHKKYEAKIRMMASPHHNTLYAAYCIKKGLM